MFHPRITSVLIAAGGLAVSAGPSTAIIPLHLPGSGYHMGGTRPAPTPTPTPAPKPMPKPPTMAGGWGGEHMGGWGYGGGRASGWGHGGGHWGGWSYRLVLGSHPVGVYGMGGAPGVYGGKPGYGWGDGRSGGWAASGGSLYARYSSNAGNLITRYGGGNLAERYGAGSDRIDGSGVGGWGGSPTLWSGHAGTWQSRSGYRHRYFYSERFSRRYRFAYDDHQSWGWGSKGPQSGSSRGSSARTLGPWAK